MKKIYTADQCIDLRNIISLHGTKNPQILETLIIALLLSGGDARLRNWGN